ncbi:MAG: glycogen/starch synthase [Muribaculaceae bacterium]|nr:glycogen/starch synthase [Muribaculaceae bacterium]
MGKKTEEKNNDTIGLLTEVSWEVCNKVGGIFTVLSTKARCLKEQFGDRLVFIGPDVWTDDNPSPWFDEKKRLLKSASSKMKLPMGISIRVGRWKIPGTPIAVLVKFDGVYEHLNTVFGKMWEEFKVDSLHAYGDYNEGCAFAVASAIVIRSLVEYLEIGEAETVAHFNEWTSGMGLLYLRSVMPQAASIFTTHATSIGRSICGNGKPLYEYFENYNGDQMAYELNMEAKHSLEKRAAQYADCFTTVSEVTALECSQLLDVTPDVVTPNGFEPDFVPSSAKWKKLRTNGRNRLFEIVEALTGHRPDSEALIVATSGRNEYRNKGLDMFIDSMGALAEKNEEKEICAFILVPAWVKEPSESLLRKISGNGGDAEYPDFATHRLNNEDSDNVFRRLSQLRAEGRIGGNRKVSIVYIPCYLDGSDGVLNIAYYDLLPAIDMTIFASYYEPWGYTPLESVAFGVPTLTTDKAGFGKWVEGISRNSLSEFGVKVIERNDNNYASAVGQIAEEVSRYAASGKEVRKTAREGAEKTASLADWSKFIGYYDQAFEIAMQKRDARMTEKNKK